MSSGGLRSLSVEHFNLTAESAEYNLDKALQTLSGTVADEADRKRFLDEMKGLKMIFRKYMQSKDEKIDWNKIKPPSDDLILPHSTLPECSPKRAKELASKLAVLKLNGGLGTTMGCVGPKSVIEVREAQSFLDLTVKQIKYLNKELGTDVPLVLMNSFNTHDDTAVILQKYSHANITIETFNQSKFPRIFKDSLTPMPKNIKDGIHHWYPPGHGDLFGSLYHSGLLQRLLDQGKEYLFVSNVDNLAATVDLSILEHMAESGAEFIMEVTNKTLADVKGGTLIDYGGRIKLLELAQVPQDKVEEFKSIKKFKIFNTNNIWVNLAAIKRVVESGELKNMDVIPNGKMVEGKQILQLETAIGAAIQFFNKAHGVNVPRTRFLPVKSTSDLLVVQSDLYQLQKGTLHMNPLRPFPTVPIVKLGPEFAKVDSYNKRFKGTPNMLELDQLTVQGDVNFGDQCVLKGTVIIVAQQGSRIDIPAGSILENKVVTGNLFILDH